MPQVMKTYQQEIALRLSRYSVTLELDPGTLEMIINRARRRVQMATLNIHPERYSAIRTLDTVSGNSASEVVEYRTTVRRFTTSLTNKVYRIGLPEDFIEIDACVVESASGEWEAREAVKGELYMAMANSNTMPTNSQPLYAIEKSPDAAAYHIYVSCGEDAIDPADVTIFYTKSLKYLELVISGTGQPDPEANVSYEFEEFVVYEAMLDCLRKTDFNNAKTAIAADEEHMVMMLEMNFNSRVDRQGLLLPSREGLYPNQPVNQLPNNSIMPDQQAQYFQNQQMQGG